MRCPWFNCKRCPIAARFLAPRNLRTIVVFRECGKDNFGGYILRMNNISYDTSAKDPIKTEKFLFLSYRNLTGGAAFFFFKLTLVGFG